MKLVVANEAFNLTNVWLKPRTERVRFDERWIDKHGSFLVIKPKDEHIQSVYIAFQKNRKCKLYCNDTVYNVEFMDCSHLNYGENTYGFSALITKARKLTKSEKLIELLLL